MASEPESAMPSRPAGSAGHRLVEHVSDCAIEAWGPGVTACLREALTALVESFALVRDAPVTSLRPFSLAPCGAEDALVLLLEEVIFNLEVRAEVPIRFHVAATEDGGFVGDMEAVPASQVELVGPLPKAVSYHDLRMTGGADGWRCHVLVDL